MCLSRGEITDILNQNEKLVKYFVSSVYHVYDTDCRYEDCLQEGRFAMYNALCNISSLDNLECKLSTILGKAIHNALYKYLGTDGPIVISYRAAITRSKLNKKLANGEELTEKEKEDLDLINNATCKIISLEAPVNSEDDLCLMDTIAAEDSCSFLSGADDLFNNIMHFIDLNENETHRAILKEYFTGIRDGKKPKLADLGKAYNMTKEAARQVISKNTKKMKQYLYNEAVV